MEEIFDIANLHTGWLVSIVVWAAGHNEATYLDAESKELVKRDYSCIRMHKVDPDTEPVVCSIREMDKYIDNVGRSTTTPSNGLVIGYRFQCFDSFSHEYVVNIKEEGDYRLKYVDVDKVVFGDEIKRSKRKKRN